jgi:hypothetical protein
MFKVRGMWSEEFVNSNYYPEQAGWPQDSDNAEDGASYLRKLKGNVAATPVCPSAQAPNSAPAAKRIGFKERRGDHRYRCSGSAEFRTEASTGRMWGTLTDISLHGCYLEMNATFPIDTKVQLVLKSCGIQIETEGTVRASYPALGMGIRFSRIRPADELQLKKLLAHLSGPGSHPLLVPNGGTDPEDPPIRNALESADPRAFVEELREFFRKNRLLSREEFHRIAKGVRRM